MTSIHLYRGLVREARKIGRVGRGESPDFVRLLRGSFETRHGQQAQQHASEMLLFLQSQRVYTELLERYNPGATMSQAERNRLTARRVGLNLPKLNSDDYYKK